MHHEIVALEAMHQPLPSSFDVPEGTTYNLTTYPNTPPDLLNSRIKDATIIITTTIGIPASALDPVVSPNLILITVSASGTDQVDLAAAKARGIRVVNCPGANIETVSEHAIGLYFAARRRTVLMDRATKEAGEWKVKKTLMPMMRMKDGRPPLTCGEEVLGVVGYGALGKRIEQLGRALGMEVLIAARKNSPTNVLPPANNNENRVPFDEVLHRSTVLVLCLPRTPETTNLISTAELRSMNPHAVLINIARGGIIDEEALFTALKEGWIAGAATDVFANEPAGGGEDSPLLSEEAKDLNITVSPHLAWFSQKTIDNLGKILKATVEGWVAGKEINVVV